MAKHDKALERICASPTPSDIRWEELVSVLRHFGYDLLKSKRGGSRRKFHNPKTGHIISIHEPHPSSIVARCYVDQIVEVLKDRGLI